MTTTTGWETVRHEGETYSVLNDHAGNPTVTEWREQLGGYAEHVCDKTGLELLEGIAPPCTPGQQIDKTTLVRTTGELFKRICPPMPCSTGLARLDKINEKRKAKLGKVTRVQHNQKEREKTHTEHILVTRGI